MAFLADIAGAILVGVRIAPQGDPSVGWALGGVGFVILGLPALLILFPAAAIWVWAVQLSAELL